VLNLYNLRREIIFSFLLPKLNFA